MTPQRLVGLLANRAPRPSRQRRLWVVPRPGREGLLSREEHGGDRFRRNKKEKLVSSLRRTEREDTSPQRTSQTTSGQHRYPA